MRSRSHRQTAIRLASGCHAAPLAPGCRCRLCWTRLGARMAYSSQRPQRREIFGAIKRMTWTERPVRLPGTDALAVRAIVHGLLRHPQGTPRHAGTARLADGRRLIGPEDTAGTGHFVLDLDDEAAHGLVTARQRPLVNRVCPWARCRLSHRADRSQSPACHPLQALVTAYGRNIHRLLADLARTLGASVAYVDRPTVEAHLERTLSEQEWTAVPRQLSAMAFDEHVGEAGSFRTDWIEAVLASAGVPGRRDTAGDEAAASHRCES